MSIAKPDSAYKKILLSKAPLKLKLRALESMEKPSERLLTQLVRNPDTHPKLRLAVADRLKKLQEERSINDIFNKEKASLEE